VLLVASLSTFELSSEKALHLLMYSVDSTPPMRWQKRLVRGKRANSRVTFPLALRATPVVNSAGAPSSSRNTAKILGCLESPTFLISIHKTHTHTHRKYLIKAILKLSLRIWSQILSQASVKRQSSLLDIVQARKPLVSAENFRPQNTPLFNAGVLKARYPTLYPPRNQFSACTHLKNHT
jgi:hypothetical protein